MSVSTQSYHRGAMSGEVVERSFGLQHVDRSPVSTDEQDAMPVGISLDDGEMLAGYVSTIMGGLIMDEKYDKRERDTAGGLPPEDVEDRLNVSIVEPDDYPEEDRKRSITDPPPDEEKEDERLNPGGSKTPPIAGSHKDKDLA